MKKNQLIELLNQIPGNPEIAIWNGFVSDYQAIDPEVMEITPVKMTFEYYKRCCLGHEAIKQHKEGESFNLDDILQVDEMALHRLRQNYNKLGYEVDDFVTADDIANKHYKAKKVYMLQGKLKGKTSWDRSGSLDY